MPGVPGKFFKKTNMTINYLKKKQKTQKIANK